MTFEQTIIMIISVLAFLFISFGYSLYEKLQDKKGYTSFLANHLKNEKLGSFFWWFLVCINSITTIAILIGAVSITLELSLISILLVFKICVINILILLLGQRIAGDFQGAANLGIYFLLSLLGWYLQIQ